jgi:glutathione S-transferase
MMNAETDALPTIYSMWACPYAQRTRALLTLKSIEHRVVEIDLTKPRPDWFLALNPTGKVPVLIHDGRALNESSIINEYLEEVYPTPSVMPATAYERAQARLLVEFCNNRFAPNMYRVLMEQDASRRSRVTETATSDWRLIESTLERLGAEGDTVFGQFGIVELTFAPFFERYVLNDYYWDFRPLERAGLARVARWRKAMLQHPAVRATGMSSEDYIKLYEDYTFGCSNGRIPPGRERSSFDLAVPLSERPMPAKRVPSL